MFKTEGGPEASQKHGFILLFETFIHISKQPFDFWTGKHDAITVYVALTRIESRSQAVIRSLKILPFPFLLSYLPLPYHQSDIATGTNFNTQKKVHIISSMSTTNPKSNQGPSRQPGQQLTPSSSSPSPPFIQKPHL